MQNKRRIVQIGVAAMTGFLALWAPANAQMGGGGGQPMDTAGGMSSSSSPKSHAMSNGSMGDKKFMKNAAQGGMAEVQLGQLAVQNAASADVKAFGQRMVDDHTKANDQLKQVAAGMSYTLPDSISSGDKAEAAKLAKMTGAGFDKAYVDYMVKDHKADVKEFEREAAHGTGSVKAFASSTLPTLQEHLKMAMDLQAKMGK